MKSKGVRVFCERVLSKIVTRRLYKRTPRLLAISTQPIGPSGAFFARSCSFASSVGVQEVCKNCGCRSPSQRIAQSRAVRGRDATDDTYLMLLICLFAPNLR